MADADGSVRRAAPAKINLALHVTGQRADGYHLIETLAVFTRFGDTIEARPAGADSFAIDGPFGGQLPADGTNLVVKAREALRAATGRALPPVAMRLTKALPVASGVGGGSSDAAAALHALAALWKLDLDGGELSRIAQPIGADLPMCLAGRPLVASGVGETVRALPAFPALTMVLVNPGAALATRDVFARLAKKDHFGLSSPEGITDVEALLGWLGETRNDLEPPARALVPAIGEAIAALTGAGAVFARMSGSGATCFGLFRSEDEAGAAAARIGAERPGWFVVATTAAGSGDEG